MTEIESPHKSDCAIHNMPAYQAGECDCGAYGQESTTNPEASIRRRTEALYQETIKSAN